MGECELLLYSFYSLRAPPEIDAWPPGFPLSECRASQGWHSGTRICNYYKSRLIITPTLWQPCLGCICVSYWEKRQGLKEEKRLGMY